MITTKQAPSRGKNIRAAPRCRSVSKLLRNCPSPSEAVTRTQPPMSSNRSLRRSRGSVAIEKAAATPTGNAHQVAFLHPGRERLVREGVSETMDEGPFNSGLLTPLLNGL